MRLLLISGSLRADSTNSAVLRTVAAVVPDGIETVLYDAVASLPHFNPDDDREGDEVHPAVAELRAQIRGAEALLICTPEYAGAMPGALKNLLEWTVGDGCTYGTPVAWINAAGPAAPTGAAGTHEQLAAVLGYVGADVVDAARVRIPVTRDVIGTDGLIVDQDIRARLVAVANALATHVAALPRDTD